MNKIIKGTAVAAAALFTATGMAQVAHADTAVSTVRAADLNLSETRINGHVAFLTDGLHVYTDGSTDTGPRTDGGAGDWNTDKAAGYFAVTGALPTSASLTWYGTQPQPGQQIVFDADGITDNGNDYNILVGEPVYGDNWWLTNGSSADAKAADPSGANDGGNGSAWFGTLAEWKTNLPNARILAGGFSLGSGVKGDGVISSMTYGDTRYAFTSNVAPTVANVTGYVRTTVGPTAVRSDLYSRTQPANTVLGAKLSWKVVVDGKAVFSTKQGFSEKNTVVARFAKHSGKHVVDVYKNGVKVRHTVIRVS